MVIRSAILMCRLKVNPTEMNDDVQIGIRIVGWM